MPLLRLSVTMALVLARAISARQSVSAVDERPIVTLAGARIDDPVVTRGGDRVYFVVAEEIRVHDRTRRVTATVFRGTAYFLSVSARGDALAFARPSEDGRTTFIWVVPLDPRTGLAAGDAHRLTTQRSGASAFSPDGRSLAFAASDAPARDRLEIVSVSGGPERVLSPQDGTIGPIRWTPDGRQIYFGVQKGRSSETLRIGLTGGPASLLVRAKSTYPGLSPSGRLVAVLDELGQLLVFDADGKALGRLGVSDRTRLYGWSTDSTPIGTTTPTVRTLHYFDLKTRALRPVPTQPGNVWAPAWSPDSRRIAFVRARGESDELTIMNSDGTGQRIIPINTPYEPLPGVRAMRGSAHRTTVRRYPPWNLWSPDGRFIAYTADRGDVSAGLTLIESATGRQQQVRPSGSQWTFLRWASDSRTLLYTVQVDTARGTSGSRRIELHRVSVQGRDQLLGERALDCLCFFPITDSTAITGRQQRGSVDLVRIEPGLSSVTLLPERDVRMSAPIVSPDQRWMVFRTGQNRDPEVLNVLEVMRTDGRERTSIPVPFGALRGLSAFLFADGQRLLSIGTAATSDSMSVYLVDVSTKRVERLLTTQRKRQNSMTDFSLSPDGETLAFITDDEAGWSVVELTMRLATKHSP